MKILVLFLVMLSGDCFGSCLVKIVRTGGNLNLALWKHTEGKNDEVKQVSLRFSEIKELDDLRVHDGATIIFNDGSFTSMKYSEGKKTMRWDNLTATEKGMIKFIRKKFDVDEH